MDKYTDIYINDFNKLKNAVIGFEFEFFTDRPYYKLLELLNRELTPIKIHGFRKYHSSFKPTATDWKIESDMSMGSDGVELVTGPMPYVDAKTYLLKVLKILKREDFSTDDKCSLHINISFDEDDINKRINKLDRLKMILNVDEEYIYDKFPTRRNNHYARSVKNIIPFKNFDFSLTAANIIQNSMELPDTKYYGINFLNINDTRLEFRYIGGEEYEEKINEILNLLDYFILLTYNSIVEPFDDDDMKKLQQYLKKNINQFKNFSIYNNFIAKFPSIRLQVDKNSDLNIINVYYDKLYDKLYDVITNIYNLNNCIINFDTKNNKFEIVDATFKTIFDIRDVVFVDCSINDGSFMKCDFNNCDIKNANISTSEIYSSDVLNCKIEHSNIDSTVNLEKCYIYNSFLDGNMKSGVFRSGKLGQNAIIGDEVEIITNIDNYFKIKNDNIDKLNKEKLFKDYDKNTKA